MNLHPPPTATATGLIEHDPPRWQGDSPTRCLLERLGAHRPNHYERFRFVGETWCASCLYERWGFSEEAIAAAVLLEHQTVGYLANLEPRMFVLGLLHETATQAICRMFGLAPESVGVERR